MSAAATDKFKKLSRRWVGQIGAGAVADGTTQTVPLSSVTNLPTDTAVVVVIDRVDADGTATPQYEETLIGVVSGTNLVNCVRGAEGTAQAHNAGAVVEVLFTAKGFNDLIDGLLIGHKQDGTHVASAITASDINGFSTDGTLASNSDNKISSQKAVKTYVDAHAGGFSSGFSVYASAGNYSIPDNAFTKLQFNTETYDLASEFDSTTNYRFTAGSTGKYLVTATAQISGLASGNKFTIAIYKNGTVYKTDGAQSANFSVTNASITGIIDLSATDYVEIFVLQASGGPLNVQGGSTVTYAMAQRLL
jgi:hypothetical protein